jgi:hypothetical protein
MILFQLRKNPKLAYFDKNKQQRHILLSMCLCYIKRLNQIRVVIIHHK